MSQFDLQSPSPIGIDGQIDTLTPLSQPEIHEDTLTPTNLRKRNQKIHSILKNSPNKVHTTSYYSTLLDSLPTANIEHHQAGNARVLFLPTKEVVLYTADYHKAFTVDLTKLEDEVKEPRQNGERIAKRHFLNDPNVPHVLSLYLQLFCNLVLVLMVMYLLYLVITNIRADVRHKIEMYTSDALQEISRCSREYYRNRCSNDDDNVRAPALEQICTNWEKCMNRDPLQIGKLKITAETFAEIVNGFFRPITWKSLFMFSFLLVGSFTVTNYSFGSYRRTSHVREMAKLQSLEMKIEEQRKQLESRQHVLPATPPSQFIGSNYDPILSESVVACTKG